MHRRLQFGMRESPASDQRHGSRLEVNPLSSPSEPSSLNDHEESQSCEPMSSIADSPNPLLIEPEKGTAGGEGKSISNPTNEVKGHSYSFGIERPLTCEEAADLARVHPRTLKRMARSGELPGHFRFGRWFFYASELDCWMRRELHSSRHSCR
jgi:excisionase family DNA binding protein